MTLDIDAYEVPDFELAITKAAKADSAFWSKAIKTHRARSGGRMKTTPISTSTSSGMVSILTGLDS